MDALVILKNRLSFMLKYATGKHSNILKQTAVDEMSFDFQAGYYKGVTDSSKDHLDSIQDLEKCSYINELGIDYCRLILKGSIADEADYYVRSNHTYYSVYKGFYSDKDQKWIPMKFDPIVMNNIVDLNCLRHEIVIYDSIMENSKK